MTVSPRPGPTACGGTKTGVPGPAVFLDRVYINTFSSLPVGKARYGVMLREDGIVMDDGTTARLEPDHFIMTTSGK